jgi:hypothetical protein
MLPEGVTKSNTSIYMVDAETSKELSKIENIKISLVI